MLRKWRVSTLLWTVAILKQQTAAEMGTQPEPVDCPVGMYREPGGGITLHECKLCPRGVYGDSEGLMSSACTAKCPKGTYNDIPGAKSVSECKLCPAGVFGSSEGLTTSACSGPCPRGKFSLVEGLQTVSDCEVCEPNYRGPQGRRGNNPNEDFEGGFPCDVYLEGDTEKIGREEAEAEALDEYIESEHETTVTELYENQEEPEYDATFTEEEWKYMDESEF